MRSHLFTLALVGCLSIAGCARHDGGKTVTREFLLERGFVQDPSDPTHYVLKGITVAEAASRLGFTTKDLIPGTNNPPDRDIRLVLIRDYELALVSEPQTNHVFPDVLTKPETACTVEARLIPQLRRKEAAR